MKLFVDYRINWIFAQDRQVATAPSGEHRTVPISDQVRLVLKSHPDERVRSALSFDDAGYKGFALLVGREPACVPHYADGTHYESGTTWPLGDKEIALVDIITLPKYRSRGYASHLIAEATAQLVPHHFARAIAFIWWNHAASLRAFRKAGWKRIGFSLELERRNRPTRALRIRL